MVTKRFHLIGRVNGIHITNDGYISPFSSYVGNLGNFALRNDSGDSVNVSDHYTALHCSCSMSFYGHQSKLKPIAKHPFSLPMFYSAVLACSRFAICSNRSDLYKAFTNYPFHMLCPYRIVLVISLSSVQVNFLFVIQCLLLGL